MKQGERGDVSLLRSNPAQGAIKDRRQQAQQRRFEEEPTPGSAHKSLLQPRSPSHRVIDELWVVAQLLEVGDGRQHACCAPPTQDLARRLPRSTNVAGGAVMRSVGSTQPARWQSDAFAFVSLTSCMSGVPSHVRQPLSGACQTVRHAISWGPERASHRGTKDHNFQSGITTGPPAHTTEPPKPIFKTLLPLHCSSYKTS